MVANPESKNQTHITEDQTSEKMITNENVKSFTEAEKKAKAAADKVTNESKEGQDSVKENIVGSAIVSAEGKSNTYTLHAETQASVNLDSYEGYTKVLSELIYQIDGCIATAKYKRGLNKSGKETLKTAKSKLKQYKDIISDKKRMLEHEFKQKNKLNAKNPDNVPLEVTISSAEIQELKRRRINRKKYIEDDINAGQRGKSSNTAPWPNQSLEQTRTGNTVDSHHVEYDSKLNDALKDTAFLSIIDNNQDRAREFLQAVANNSLSDAQITICQIRKAQLDPYFAQYGMTDQVHKCIQTRGGKYTQSYQNYGNMDLETAYKTGGIKGGLNNLLIKGFPNAKPEQVSNFTNIAVTAGGIYAIYRIGKWFFGKDKEGERNLLGKGIGLASLYFVPQLLVGKDGYSLLGEMLSGKADFSELRYRLSNCLWFMNNSSPEVYAQMAPGVLGMSIFPQTYTVAKVRALQKTFSEDSNARKQRYLATYTRLNKDNSALANEFKNTFNANEYKESERKAFLEKLGITDKTSGDTPIFNEAAKTTDKKHSFELWLKSEGKERKPEFKEEIDEYLKKDGEFNPKELNKNWFKDIKDAKYTMRELDIENKEKLGNQVDELSLDEQQKSELKTALETFYDERTIDSKPDPNNFNLKMEGDFLILTSHGGYKSKIDLKNKKLDGFGNGSIGFTNLSDLLNTADLSNKILETQKGKMAVDTPPFLYKLGRGIYFNNAKGIRNDLISFNWSGTDTRVLSSGPWGTSQKIDEIDKNLKDYADYLSKRRTEINISSST